MNEPGKPFDAAVFTAKVLHELNTEERFVNYFNDFLPGSAEMFKKHYANQKAQWHRHGDEILIRAEQKDLKWISAAWDQLNILQQKKLFDQQCLWRAEKLTIEGVEICYDFDYWENDILNCPFIEPISTKEIELYGQYLNSNNVQLEQEWFMHGWQDYEEIKESYATDNANRNFPEWYDFHNGRTGTGVYMTLPDIRGSKEEVYINLHHKDWQGQNQEQWDKQEQMRDKRPTHPIFGDDLYDYFVSTFEDKQTQKYYKAYQKVYRKMSNDEEMVDTSLWELQHSPDPFPIEAHYDWRQAIIRAAEKFRCHQISLVLPDAYEEYKMRLSSGLPFERDEQSLKGAKFTRNMVLDQILNGRALKGEPRDLNF